MRFTRIDHIGIAVTDFDAAVARYTALHGAPPARVTEVPGEQVRVALFAVRDARIELLGATAPESPIARFLARRGEGLHHVCYAVPDLAGALAALAAEGITPVRQGDAGADGAPYAFLHPRDTHGVLIELVEPSGGVIPA